MKIEKQVCTLQQAKILKELGAPQNSVFTWLRPLCKDDFIVEYGNAEQLQRNDKAEGNLIRRQLPAVKDREFYAAYTVAELGAMLDKQISCISFDGYRYTYSFINKHLPIEKQYIAQPAIHFDTEAQARASLLIYLLRENIVLDSIVAHRFKR